MKKLFLILSLTGFVVPAFAGPCVALDYQEMKDMSAEELAKEYCKVNDAWSVNMDYITRNLETKAGPKPYPNAQENFDQCYGQVQRIQRILASKGMDKETADKHCSQRSTGQTNTIPTDAK